MLALQHLHRAGCTLVVLNTLSFLVTQALSSGARRDR